MECALDVPGVVVDPQQVDWGREEWDGTADAEFEGAAGGTEEVGVEEEEELEVEEDSEDAGTTDISGSRTTCGFSLY